MAYTTIDKPTDYFNTVLYTGNGSTQSITGVGFQPDWVWCKSRSQADNHAIFDSVRGGQQQLRSNTTGAELTRTNAISSFDSDGWSMGSQPEMNSNTITYASWNWLAGGTASSNTDGSITSSVSANTTAGFSIVTYTGNGVSGATIGHGLSTTAPKIVLIKKRNASDNWTMLNTNLSSLNVHLHLTTDGQISDPMFNNTAPTTSVFTVDADGQVNGNTNTFVAYCFSEVKGYSKFGSYTGNGNADGTFVYTGFKPAWLLIKRSDGGTDNWNLYDNKRLGYNTNYSFLIPNESNAENTTTSTANLDILSNGFKIRGSTGHTNTSGGTYIYMAFAESPFVNSNGVPNNAR
jgi:hypothetical protein